MLVESFSLIKIVRRNGGCFLVPFSHPSQVESCRCLFLQHLPARRAVTAADDYYDLHLASEADVDQVSVPENRMFDYRHDNISTTDLSGLCLTG